MARDTAGLWILVLVFYFIALSILLTGINEINTSSEINSTGGGLGEIEFDTCTPPRLNGIYTQPYANTNNRCDFLVKVDLVNDNNTCESFEGCSWEEGTFLFFFGTGTYTCKGFINKSYYNNGTASPYKDQICTLYNLTQSKELCDNFGCTWSRQTSSLFEVNEEELGSIRGISRFIKNLFTLSFNFGFENTGVNAILNFIFVIVPLIILGLSLYVLIR